MNYDSHVDLWSEAERLRNIARRNRAAVANYLRMNRRARFHS